MTTQGYTSYAVDDGTVTGYLAGSFLEVCSADGRARRYALTPHTRVDAARLTAPPVSLGPGAVVNLTARLDGDRPVATTVRVLGASRDRRPWTP